jgi:hypothetical protein
MDFVCYYKAGLTVESVKAHLRSIGFVVPLCHARICLAEHIVHIYCDQRLCFDSHVQICHAKPENEGEENKSNSRV